MCLLSPAVSQGAFALAIRYSQPINRLADGAEVQDKPKAGQCLKQRDKRDSCACLCPKPDSYFNLCLSKIGYIEGFLTALQSASL